MLTVIVDVGILAFADLPVADGGQIGGTGPGHSRHRNMAAGLEVTAVPAGWEAVAGEPKPASNKASPLNIRTVLRMITAGCYPRATAGNRRREPPESIQKIDPSRLD